MKKVFFVFLGIVFLLLPINVFSQRYDSAGNLIVDRAGFATGSGDALLGVFEDAARFGAGVGNVVGDVLSGQSPSTRSFMDGWNDNSGLTGTISDFRNEHNSQRQMMHNDASNWINHQSGGN